MKKSRWFLTRVLPSFFVCSGAALIAAGHASAGGDIDCSPAAQAGYMVQRRLHASTENLPAILAAQQNAYSCHVKTVFPDLQQAQFLARAGQRGAHLAHDLLSMSMSSCSSIHSAFTATIDDMSRLQGIDHSAELQALKLETMRLADMSCVRLVGQSYADDHFTDPLIRDFCAYKKTVEALPNGHGSTSGFSTVIAPCFRFH